MNCLGQWYLWVFALALAWHTVLGQEVDLNFSTERCIAQNQWSNMNYSDTIDGVVTSGCTIALLCQYRSCQSTKKKLKITLNDAMLNKAIVERNSSSCGLEVFITNLTVEFHKKEVRCNKKDNQEVTLQKRTLEVGYPPPRPRNLTVEYHPLNYIHLWLDPVQSAQDLNDNNTKWSVNYFWRLNQCQNFTATSRSRHLACSINLTGLLSEDDMYAGHGGSTRNKITFSVNVSNKFGENNISKNFNLVHFIKPSRVNATLVTAGSSWLFIRASLDNTMFKYCGRMNRSLRVEYTVHSVSEADDQKLRTERKPFHKEFGFYRNLPDDEAALVYQNATSYLPYTKKQKWNCRKQTVDINVTNLEPYSHYQISFCLLGKYRGLETTDTYGTSDDKPLRPPKFGISPYYCFTGDQDTVSCVIYFQEIPRVLRRAKVSNYTLEGLDVGNGHFGNIPGCRNFTERADGQDNSLLVKNLSPDCVYNISLTAETQLGQSPPATHILDAKDIGKLVDVEVVLDLKNKSHPAYTVYWNSANWAQEENISYYIHYCYTTKAENFKCMTNLVTQAANNSLSYSKIVLTPYSSTKSSLMPTFFVSALHNGKTSGMVKEKWRYCTDQAPTKIKSLIVTRSDSDPTNLEVRFQRADSDSSDCKGGQPTQFVVSWTKCSNGCNQKEDSKSMNFQMVNAYRKDPIILRGLNQSTTYCVWVKAQGSNTNSSSVCESATTARRPEETFESIIVVGILIVLTISVTAACVSICFYYRKVKAKVRRIHVDWPKPSIKTGAVTRPALHSSFHTFTKLSAGPGHILSGDSGIDDEGVDAVYEKSLLTANGEDRSCSEQAKTVHNRARDCGGQQFSWSSGSTQPSQLHTEQENELSHKGRYQPAARAPSCSSAECDDEEDDGDEEEESLIESEEEESLSEKEETELSGVPLKRSECSFVTCPSFDMQTALAKLPEALFQQLGPEPRGLKPRPIMSSSEESAEESDR